MEGGESETASTSGRACDACRSRKTRCDRVQPCSNCRLNKVTCRYSPKVNDNRQRVLISSRYEKQVESIDERLQGIEKGLQTLLNDRSGNSGDSPFLSAATNATSSAPKTKMKISMHPGPDSVTLEDNKYEGDTSLLSHSLQAKGLFEKLTSNYSVTKSPKLKQAISTLQATLKTQSKPATFQDLQFSDKQQSLDSSKLSELEMPPVNVVLDLLRYNNNIHSKFILEMPIITLPDLTEMCQSLYFCTTGYSQALFVVVNKCLYTLFHERWLATGCTEDQQYASTCGGNVALVLDNLPLLMAPSLESCQALILGAFYATHFAKPSLCLRMTSNAAQMCQSLGYHRLPVMKVETRELKAKKLVFWGTYFLDKGLSLRLGRTSLLQDSDISTTYPAAPKETELQCWHQLHIFWIEFAKLQGRIYDELYTVAALSTPLDARESKARKLAADIHELHERHAIVPYPNTPHAAEFQLDIDSNNVMDHAVLTIVYQAIPPSPSDLATSPIFYSECIKYARNALDSHLAVTARVKANDDNWKDYVQWTLLFSPFAPFMVVFCEAIATLNTRDLHSLRDFVASIEPASDDSQAAIRMHELCSAFYQVANVYFEETGAITDAGVSEPSELQMLNSFGGENMLDLNEYMTWPTEDWFLNDQYMMGNSESGVSGM